MAANLIAVVDDNEVGRYGKVRMLQRAGFEVIEAANGTDALQLAEARNPRLIVLDVQMPDIDGWEVCRRLKANPKTASVLVLQVSATYVREEDTVQALEGGADGCLTEPIEGPVLIATVRALLRARQAEDALRDALEREQMARAAAEDANRTKDEFLAILSHELRSPLNAIVSWVTLLRSGRLDDARTAHGFDAIERNTQLQVRLIEDLLDVSRIISGKMHLEMGLVDLGRLVDAALDSLRPAAQAKGIQLDVITGPSPGLIPGDASRLQQVVWNLISNAIKFTDKGGRVEIQIAEVESKAQIRVADNGRGIDGGFLPHLFERFRQADSSSTRSEGGLGLGLAIVRHLVELHGGTIAAESGGRGRGATFTVRLPIPAVDVGAVSDPSAARGASVLPQHSLNAVRILVVDDEPDARDAIAAVLVDCGAEVTTVASVRQALDALDRDTPDVIVSDLAMPAEDGYSFIRAVRKRSGDKTTHVPAMALSACGGGDEPQRALAIGYDAYLIKPVDPAALLATVQRLVTHRAR